MNKKDWDEHSVKRLRGKRERISIYLTVYPEDVFTVSSSEPLLCPENPSSFINKHSILTQLVSDQDRIQTL